MTHLEINRQARVAHPWDHCRDIHEAALGFDQARAAMHSWRKQAMFHCRLCRNARALGYRWAVESWWQQLGISYAHYVNARDAAIAWRHRLKELS